MTVRLPRTTVRCSAWTAGADGAVPWDCGAVVRTGGQLLVICVRNNATGPAAASSVRTGDLRPPASASDPLRVKAATRTTVFTHRACADLQIRTPDWTQ